MDTSVMDATPLRVCDMYADALYKSLKRFTLERSCDTEGRAEASHSIYTGCLSQLSLSGVEPFTEQCYRWRECMSGGDQQFCVHQALDRDLICQWIAEHHSVCLSEGMIDEWSRQPQLHSLDSDQSIEEELLRNRALV